MSTMVTELAVPLRGSKLRAASRREGSRREVRAMTLDDSLPLRYR
ncbi:MAG: hypothetical protein ACYTX0_16040 [Nostoc sp.]